MGTTGTRTTLTRGAVLLALAGVAYATGWLQATANHAPAGPPPAHHSPATEPTQPPTDALDEEAALAALGYVDAVEPAPQRTGVTAYDPDRTQPGWNLVLSAHAATASVQTLSGEVVHTWTLPFEAAFPDEQPRGPVGFWRMVHLREDGGLLVIYEGHGIASIARDSTLEWALSEPVHHDVDVLPDGRYAVLASTPRVVPDFNPDATILEDEVLVLSTDGRVEERHSIFEAVRRSDRHSVLRMTRKWHDIFHTNTLEVLDGRLADRIPAFASGRVLLTIPFLDALAVFDLQTDTIEWMRVGGWLFPHKGTVLDNGHLMVFDNRGHNGVSKVVELDPTTQQTVWGYYGDADNGFYSYECGAAQRLDNGNTLITETDAGRAFEVTADGAMVWELVNPETSPGDPDKVARIMEVVRLAPSAWPR